MKLGYTTLNFLLQCVIVTKYIVFENNLYSCKRRIDVKDYTLFYNISKMRTRAYVM